MRKLWITICLSVAVCAATAQIKTGLEYNKFLNMEGTAYTVASVMSWSKLGKAVKSNLLFINTSTGDTRMIDFAEGARLNGLTQIRIESLGINLLLLVARTVDLNEKKGIGWQDPQQIFLLSPDGETKKQLTEDNFYVSTWSINQQTGTLIVAGYLDVNKNRKKDKDESSEILLFDLQTMKQKQSIRIDESVDSDE